MKTKNKLLIIGIAFVLITALFSNFVYATTENAPATGESALSSQQASQQIDSDQDGLSDYDEVYIYGTNPLRESTDGDFYDDGQEILGFSPANYGQLGGQMPSYVKWPGNSPFVAAYPQIEFTVDPTYRIVLNQDIHFANRTQVKFERTFGSIVTTTVSNEYGVSGSHTVGEHIDTTNSQADSITAGTTKNELNGESTTTTQTEENSKVRTAGWDTNAGVEVDVTGPKATGGVGYVDRTTTTDKTIKSNSIGTNTAKEAGSVTLSGTIVENSVTSGATSSATITASTSQTITTSVSSVNLYTVGTANEWETGWSQNTVDAARLFFNFNIKNTGTDRTVGISDLRFTVKIGPYVKTYPSLDKTGITLPALNPGEMHIYSGDGIPLSIDELKEFDTKGKVQIYVEDYNLGNSREEAYALDAYEGGTLFIIDDGSKDDGSNFQYYLAHIEPGDTYGDILLRLNKTVPVGSPNNPKKVLDIAIVNGTISSIAGLAVEDNAAWFIQTEGISEKPFLFKEAKPGSKVIMTYSKDTDNDNYPDRVERRAGTNPDDLNSHPNPNVVAGYYVGNVAITIDNVTYEKTKPVFTLKPKVANIGNYDAYGAEIRMLAANSDIDITDNFAGGSVRVKPNETFVLNDTLVWKPKAPGAKSNNNFIVNNSNIQVQYADSPSRLNDGFANSNPDLAAVCSGLLGVTGYESPWLGDYKSCLIILPESEVLYKLNFFVPYPSATIIEVSQDNKSWTRVYDVEWPVYFNEITFAEPIYAQYIRISGHSRRWIDGTAISVPFSLSEVELYRYEYGGKPVSQINPIVEALYNDPQGPHRFISTTKISNENASIKTYESEMERGLDLSISSPADSLTYGNAANVQINFANAHNASIENGKLFVSYRLANGTALKTFTQLANFQPGNTRFDFNLNTAEISKEIIGKEIAILAIAADYQGNTIAEQVKTVEIENPVKILNYVPGDVPNPVAMQRNELKRFAVFAAAPVPLSYKWFLDGVQITNANANTYDCTMPQTGNHTLKVELSDGTYTNTQIWNLEVLGTANNQPVLEPIADITVSVGQDIIVRPHAFDIDNDTLSYTFSGTINFTELANGTFIAALNSNGTYPTKFTVSDGNGGSASQNFTVYVNAIIACGNCTPPANNTTNQTDPNTNPNSANAGSGGGGSGDSPNCNLGYELKNGKCVPKQATPSDLERIDKQNSIVEGGIPEKPSINIEPQTASRTPQTDSKGNIVTGLFTAVNGKISLAALILILALAAGYYLFTRKYSLKVEFAQPANKSEVSFHEYGTNEKK